MRNYIMWCHLAFEPKTLGVVNILLQLVRQDRHTDTVLEHISVGIIERYAHLFMRHIFSTVIQVLLRTSGGGCRIDGGLVLMTLLCRYCLFLEKICDSELINKKRTR